MPRHITGIIRELLFFALLIVVLFFVAIFFICVTRSLELSIIWCKLIDKTLDCVTDVLEIALGLLVPRFLLE